MRLEPESCADLMQITDISRDWYASAVVYNQIKIMLFVLSSSCTKKDLNVCGLETGEIF